jgi:hypothetical protein
MLTSEITIPTSYASGLPTYNPNTVYIFTEKNTDTNTTVTNSTISITTTAIVDMDTYITTSTATKSITTIEATTAISHTLSFGKLSQHCDNKIPIH